jgi:hypothetical protein
MTCSYVYLWLSNIFVSPSANVCRPSKQLEAISSALDKASKTGTVSKLKHTSTTTTHTSYDVPVWYYTCNKNGLELCIPFYTGQIAIEEGTILHNNNRRQLFKVFV